MPLFSHCQSEYTHMWKKQYRRTKPSPRGEGSERSEPDRVLAVRKRAGRDRLKYAVCESTRAPLTRSLFPNGEDYDMGMALSPYCHFERKREIFFVRGQAKDVRIAASGKHRASSESEGRCFMQTALRKKTETGNEKDPSAALGMTKRGNASFHSFSTCCGSQPRLAALGSPFQGKGLAWTLPPSYGRRCPEGAEVGWGSGMKESEEMHLKSTINESTLSIADAVPSSLRETGRGIHFSFTNFHLSMI